MEIIHATSMVHISVRKWGGTVKANDTDYTANADENAKLPPEALVKRGSKQVCPTDLLTPFDTFRKKCERICLSTGFRECGMFLVPDAHLDDITDQLNALQPEWDALLENFWQTLEPRVREWIAQNAEYAHILKHHFDTARIAKSFSFDVKVIKGTPMAGFEDFEDRAADQVLHEVGQLCKAQVKSLRDRKHGISGEDLRSKLDPMITKLAALAFSNGRMNKVLGEFRVLRDALPTGSDKVEMSSTEVSITRSFLNACGDEDQLEDILDGRYDVGAMLNALETVPAVRAQHHNSNRRVVLF